MSATSKILLCCLFLFAGINPSFSQKSCCAKGSKQALNCISTASTLEGTKSTPCCSTKPKESTSGCTPSQCRGAKTKFGEAKVISELRQNLIALKARMENHPKYQFTNEAITVHDIVGETDDESLMIVSKHVTVIQSEILDQSKQKLPVIKDSENKAIQVKQLNNRIADLSQIL